MSAMTAVEPSPPAPADRITELTQTISPSKLSLFQSCRLKFFFRYVLGLTHPKSAALHVGGAVHETLRAWNRARWRREVPSLGGMYGAYEEAWYAAQINEAVAWEDGAEEAEQKKVGWRLLETFFRETAIRVDDKPEAVEAQVEADLSSHGLPRLVGVLDLVQSGAIIDFKTTGQTPTPEKAALLNATQITAYSLLYRENTGRKETGVELHHLVKLKQPRLVVIGLTVDDAQISRLFRVIEAYVAGLERQDFIPSPGLQCAACEFVNECRAWH